MAQLRRESLGYLSVIRSTDQLYRSPQPIDTTSSYSWSNQNRLNLSTLTTALHCTGAKRGSMSDGMSSRAVWISLSYHGQRNKSCITTVLFHLGVFQRYLIIPRENRGAGSSRDLRSRFLLNGRDDPCISYYLIL